MKRERGTPKDPTAKVMRGRTDPMPCGFEVAGLRLKERLAHYRKCSDPACKERASTWNGIVTEYRKSLGRDNA